MSDIPDASASEQIEPCSLAGHPSHHHGNHARQGEEQRRKMHHPGTSNSRRDLFRLFAVCHPRTPYQVAHPAFLALLSMIDGVVQEVQEV